MYNLKEIHLSLYRWYQQYGRKNLPWRITHDPYAIYISEVMLQQTQVQTVLERYYSPFLAQFPTLEHLAQAEQKEVLKAWQGLGYYSRAVNVHKAAKIAAPELPRTVEGLLALPGIGKNTAHAVAAFAYQLPVPVMEANVKRILYRFFALEKASSALLWEKAFALLDPEHPFDYNQVMMDIGALICTKTKPKCLECPLNECCSGKAMPERYPTKIPKKTPPTLHKNIVAFHDENGRYYLSPRSSRFLYGLYGFAEYEKAEEVLFKGVYYPVAAMEHLGSIVQSYSHFTLEAEIYRQRITGCGNALEWKNSEEISNFPLSRADSKVIHLLQKCTKD